MKHILCFGDSNTWGFRAADGGRFGADIRWTLQMEKRLGQGFRVVEEGMNARTTCIDDPLYPGRNGLANIEVCLQSHKPIDVAILMLGSNDMKCYLRPNAVVSARGMALIVEKILGRGFGPEERDPEILIVSPVKILPSSAESFFGRFDAFSVEESARLSPQLRALAEELGCHFFDAASVAAPDPLDGLHMDAASHAALAEALAEKVKQITG